jgi:hypothetical protein
MNLLALNLDVLEHILDELHHADILQLALASRKSYTVAASHLFRHITLAGLPEIASFAEFLNSPRGAVLRASTRSLVVDVEQYVAGMGLDPGLPHPASEECTSHLQNEMTQCSAHVVRILSQLRALRRLELFDGGHFVIEDPEAVLRDLPCLSAIGVSRTKTGARFLSQTDRPLDTILIPDFHTYRNRYGDHSYDIQFDLSRFSSTLRTLSLDGRDLATLPPQAVFSRVTHLVVWGWRPPDDDTRWSATRTVFPSLCVLEYLITYIGARARARAPGQPPWRGSSPDTMARWVWCYIRTDATLPTSAWSCWVLSTNWPSKAEAFRYRK